MTTETGATFLSKLTDKQSKVCVLVAQGMPNKKIAEQLETTEQVIKNQIRSVLAYCNLETRQELIIYLFRHRVVQCPCERKDS